MVVLICGIVSSQALNLPRWQETEARSVQISSSDKILFPEGTFNRAKPCAKRPISTEAEINFTATISFERIPGRSCIDPCEHDPGWTCGGGTDTTEATFLPCHSAACRRRTACEQSMAPSTCGAPKWSRFVNSFFSAISVAGPPLRGASRGDMARASRTTVDLLCNESGEYGREQHCLHRSPSAPAFLRGRREQPYKSGFLLIITCLVVSDHLRHLIIRSSYQTPSSTHCFARRRCCPQQSRPSFPRHISVPSHSSTQNLQPCSSSNSSSCPSSRPSSRAHSTSTTAPPSSPEPAFQPTFRHRKRPPSTTCGCPDQCRRGVPRERYQALTAAMALLPMNITLQE
jgi:hypothetical protein